MTDTVQRCQECNGTNKVQQAPCRTMYPDPAQNVSPLLCEGCEDEYHDYWDEQWAEVPGFYLAGYFHRRARPSDTSP